MGLLESIFGKKTVATPQATGYFKTLTAYKPVFTSRSGSAYESALVRAAIDSRARHISKLNIVVNGEARPILKNQLKKRPNNFMTWSQFFYRLSTILDMQNTAFILRVYDKNEVVGYYPVLPSQCEIVNVKGHSEPWVRYKFANNQYGADSLFNVGILTKFQYQSDFFGSPNTALDQTLDLIDLQNKGITEAVKTSASYKFMAQMSNFSKLEDLKAERKKFDDNNFSNDAENGGILLFPSTWGNIKQLDPKNYVVDATQAKQIETNVYNYFGVNEDIIQNKAIGDVLLAFFEGAVEPFAIQFSEVITNMTYTDRELGTGNKIIATGNRIQYMSTDKKISLAQQLGDRGFITINEIRELFNYPPIDEGGDLRPIRGEYYLIDQEGQITTKEGTTDAN